jgi:two-component system phosphate regulon response regulator PhoB
VAARFWLASGIADVLVLSDEVIEHGPDGTPWHSQSRDGAEQRASIIVLTRRASGPPNYHADDTLRRPIAVSRVVERVESLIQERRLRGGALLRFGELSLDPGQARASFAGQSIDIGQTEARLLAFFIGAPDRVFSRRQLLQRLWPATVRVEERTVDVHIRRLRLGLDRLGCAGYVQTVRGSGYRFSAIA